MNAREGRPGEPEEADGEDGAADAAEGKASLGREGAAVGDEVADVALVVEHVGRDGEDHADADGDEGQAADAGAPAALLLVDYRVRAEEEVQNALQECARASARCCRGPRDEADEGRGACAAEGEPLTVDAQRTTRLT